MQTNPQPKAPQQPQPSQPQPRSPLRPSYVPPLELNGVSKYYNTRQHPNNIVVDNLSFSIQKGQIFGLLGLNGAGKTTTLRMITGLVHPNKGKILVLGEEMHPGSEVLKKVGCLIEKPGFIPHLSGMANLELFWRSGGSGLLESHLDDALQVADLGPAIYNPYKTYSQGMRQRLAIAQAMLGKPELLILDEPFNGLDPHQMRETRKILRNLAETGVTVLFSSHLLNEVEQLCTHAAIINLGKLVTAGSVASIRGTKTTVYLEVDNLPGALVVLGGLPGIKHIRQETGGISIELSVIERKEVLNALVRAGIGVETFSPRYGLEDAFLQILGTE
ncbi:MAG: ABC transporter ATP-binding protein [Actinobacteria bacterium]|nr:ABC transporter ATP-binding protein [Actinomycetota bacterium]